MFLCCVAVMGIGEGRAKVWRDFSLLTECQGDSKDRPVTLAGKTTAATAEQVKEQGLSEEEGIKSTVILKGLRGGRG